MNPEGDYTQGSTEGSVYKRRQYDSGSIQSVAETENTSIPYNFVTFLATVMKFHVPILHITWQSHRKVLGRGATSQVNEAQTSLENSFAFKRIPDLHKQEALEADIYQQLITEMSILRHPAFRVHPNVVELQGVCWDVDRIQNLHRAREGRATISNGFTVWPVLVFETSKCGDLYQFATSPPGRDLDISQRLNICIAVGRVIADMQSYRIVHGDIKPQNVLIFKKDQEFYPKVADFGFSVSHLHPETRLSLPFSEPWVAPEHSRSPEFDLKEALQADVFSCGMLCFWVLFERQLSGTSPVPGLARWQIACSADSKYPSLDLLSHLKSKDALREVSGILIKEDAGLDVAKKEMLTVFFERCLRLEPQLRPINVHDSLEFLVGEQRELPPRIEVTNTNNPIGLDMKLSLLLHVFYQGDYRVREHIFNQLKESYSSHPDKATCAHLAVCCKLAFGCREDDGQQQVAAHDHGCEAEVEAQLNSIRTATAWVNGNAAHAYCRAASQGFHGLQSSTSTYRHDGVLQTAERAIRVELKRAEEVLGTENRCSLYLKGSLSSVLNAQNRWQEAQEIQVQVVESLKEQLGPQQIETLASMSTLCSMYQNLGRWKDAVDLESEVVEALRSKLGYTHADTLACMLSLGTSNTELARWEEAEKLQTRVVKAYKKILGEEHATTMTAMETLAKTYAKHDKFKQAGILGLQVIEASTREFGPEHPSTLLSMGELANTYGRQGHWRKAEELLVRVSEACKRVLGDEHLVTLARLANLANCYWKLNRAKESTDLFEQVIEVSERVLGPCNPHTLEEKKALASSHLSRGETQVAEKILLELLEQHRETMGHQHPSTLETMEILAGVYFCQRRYMEALPLVSEVLEEIRKSFGPTHPKALQGMMNVSSIFVRQGRTKDAESLQEQTLHSLKSTVGERHPKTLSCMQELAETYAHRGRLPDANELMHSCVQLRTETLGPDHPDTKFSGESRWMIYDKEVEVTQRMINDEGLFEITTDVLLGAAESPSIGVFPCLLRMTRGNPKLCPEVVEVVAGNEDAGYHVMAFLLDEYRGQVEITADVLDAVFWNEKTGTALMEMLLEKRHGNIKITAELLERAAEGRSSGMMAFVLKMREETVKITEKMGRMAASNENLGDEAVSALLEACPREFNVTTSILVAAAGNMCLGDRILKLLLKDRNCKVPIGTKVLKAAAANRWKGAEAMSVLLEERGSEVKITESVIKTAAHNAIQGEEVLQVLLEARGGDMKITENILLSLVKSPRNTQRVIQLLLEKRGSKVEITEHVLIAATRKVEGT